MRAIDILMIAIVLLAILLLISNHYHTYGDFSLSTSSISKTDSKSIIINQKEMLALERANQRLKNENVTISRKTLVDDNRIISSLTDLIKSKDFQIEELLNQLEELKSLQSQKEELILLNISNSIESASSSVNTNPDSSLPSKKYSLDVEDVELQKHCEAKFGVSLIDNWQACKEIWCGASSNSNTNSKTSENTSNKDNLNSGAKTQSELRCYPYHQLHKQNDGRGPDMFCEATNFMIDFSKVHGKASGSKPHLGAQYHSFDMGSLQGNCHITNKYRSELFMPHHALQMRSFQANTSLSADLEVVDHPVYLLARDEDCENTFHHTADLVCKFMNFHLLLCYLIMSYHII